jgi:hypothetical protein
MNLNTRLLSAAFDPALLPDLEVDAIADGMIESRLRSPAIELKARALESHH